MNYVPRILLCGDVNSFQSAAGDMAVEIIGQISFTGSAERGENLIFTRHDYMDYYKPSEIKIFLNGVEISADELRKLLDGAVDYIVFDDAKNFIGRRNDLHSLGLAERYIPRENLFRQARHNFYSANNLETLSEILRDNKISSLLDIDGIFYDTDYFLSPEKFPTVEGVIQKPEPILENFYGKIYATLADCRFKFYDAIFIGERGPEDFINVLLEANDLSENILTFARKNSALKKFLAANENAFEKILRFPAVNGNWYLIQKRAQKNFCVYVVTHKDPKLAALPEGYKMIHAGHAQAKEDFGYIGDDTGDNISRLNLYLNEVTALYWMWKNTSHTIIGLNHYRRFFTSDGENIFNAYCEWLFSFLLDVMEEVLAKTNIAEIKNSRKYRVVGNFSERLMTVWLWKNHLRIKKLPIIFRKGI